MKFGSALFCLLLLLSFNFASFSQSVAINNAGAAPHPSAILDIAATNKGLLIPRMNSSQRGLVSTPATGLQVFDTDTKSFWFWNGTAWVEFSAGSTSSFWSLNGSHIFNNNSGNVGIGLNTPGAPLHIKNELEALRIQGTTPYLSFYNNAGSLRGFVQQYNDSLLLGTPSSNTRGIIQFYLGNQPVMTLTPFGSVYIGSNNFANEDFSIGRGANSLGLSVFANNTRLTATNDIVLNPANGSGYVGINTSGPSNKLQIGSMGATNFATNDLAIGNGTNAMAIQQTNESTLLGSSTDIVFRPRNNGTGYVGINTLTAPANKLQIGSMGATNFSTNDLAIGNGTHAMAIYVTNASTAIGATNDIILMPRNNGLGRVGINTNTPRAALDVTDGAGVAAITSYGYSYMNGVSAINNGGLIIASNSNPVPNVSIMASGRVYAIEFDAFSDARIKDVIGKSNPASDLATVNALRITDYTMKDKVKYGNQPFKKVIAQEVEKVYPQVVSKHTDFIPNVYQVAASVAKMNEGLLLTFSHQHNISKAAKKLRALASKTTGMSEYEIVSIPNDKQVVIKAAGLKADKIFVYGEEVDDFRTVDYEGLTTLNISATQGLSKLVQKQQAQLDEQAIKLAQLTEAVKAMKETRMASANPLK